MLILARCSWCEVMVYDWVENCAYIHSDTLMSIEVTEEQNQLLRELRALDPEPHYRAIIEQPSSSNSIPPPQTEPRQIDLLYEVDFDSEHAAIREKLLRYRNKSEQIQRVGELIGEYAEKFGQLMREKEELIGLIERMKGATSQLVQRQKQMIDLSMKMKQCLDYYSYHDKLRFDYPCEVAARELFENTLQPLLSELTDGMQYFQENTTYTQSKKYLTLFQSTRSKILSFAKSFFIKLFNREQAFALKHAKPPLPHPLAPHLDSLYPKSRAKFIHAFLLVFPQFQGQLQEIVRGLKEGCGQEQARGLQMREVQIGEFELSKSNLALIGYLQRNMPEVYSQAILTFFTYYRHALHQALTKIPFNRDNSFPELFAQRTQHLIYVVSCEYAYQTYCCRANLPDSSETVRANVAAICKLYADQLVRFLKDPRNNSPFQLCETVSRVREQIPTFLENHLREEYQSYAFGAVTRHLPPPAVSFLHSQFSALTARILAQMEVLCFNSLAKVGEGRGKREVEEGVRQFLSSIPKLRYCQSHAQRYLIGSLDALLKSIKEVNSRMESRFECYLWNLQLFGNIRGALRSVRGSLVRKELKLDVNNSANIIERVRGIERNQSLLKYAQDILNVLKTGMPVINELTLDFGKFIGEHCQALEAQFVKDILFIYAKNMIEFLHHLAEAPSEQDARNICTPNVVNNLYSAYLLSIQKYLKEANALLADWKTYQVGTESQQLIPALLTDVYERLFDLLDKFYVNTSKFAPTETFREIQALKQSMARGW